MSDIPHIIFCGFRELQRGRGYGLHRSQPGCSEARSGSGLSDHGIVCRHSGGALTATLGLRLALPTDALAPVIATLLFALAAAAAGLAFLCRRNQIRTAWLDIAGSLTFVGVAVSILIEPDQMVRLLTLSEQSD